MEKLFKKLNTSELDAETSKLLENTTLHLLGGKEKGLKKIEELKEQTNSDGELIALILKETSLDTLADLSKNLQNFNSFKGIFEVLAKFKNTDTENEKLINCFKLLSELPPEIVQSINAYAISKLDLDKNNYKEELQKKYLYTTKEKIAEEFEINKRTLNKWLEHFFGNKYDRKRKIYFQQYVEIFETFMDANLSGELQINLNDIQRRLKKGRNYNKTDITYLTSSDLKTQKDNLKHTEPYNFMDVFPYSLTKVFVEKMGSKVVF